MSSYKQMYQVLRRGYSKLKEVKVGNKARRFWRRIIDTPDKRWAEDVKAKYPHDVTVIPFDSTPEDPTGIHRYSWELHSLGDWKSRIDWGEKDGV